MNKEIIVPVIGYMCAPFSEKFGTPRQPNLVNSTSYIVMQAPYDNLDAFIGLEQFSHIWLLWQFHDNKRKNSDKDFQPLIRPPRLGGNQKIGVFASRSMYRPAPIGLSVVQFIEIKQIAKEIRVYVKGADLIDGTPIIDIKPYLAYADAITDAVSGYAMQAPQALDVIWSDTALMQRQKLLDDQISTPQIMEEIEQVLAQNPKPAYQHDFDKIYGLSYATLNIKFKVGVSDVLILSLI